MENSCTKAIVRVALSLTTPFYYSSLFDSTVTGSDLCGIWLISHL